MSVKDRIRRLEHGAASCPECYLKPERTLAYYPQRGAEPPRVPACPACGRPLAHVVRVVFGEGEAEGEG